MGQLRLRKAGTRSASVEGKVEQPGVFVGVDVWKAKLDVAIRRVVNSSRSSTTSARCAAWSIGSSP